MDEDAKTLPMARNGALSHKTGESLDTLSLHELDERIELLKSEILRLQSVREAKVQSQSAAEALFKL
jgi:uncharacterized small protein (DUF1192 family)